MRGPDDRSSPGGPWEVVQPDVPAVPEDLDRGDLAVGGQAREGDVDVLNVARFDLGEGADEVMPVLADVPGV